MRVSSQVLRDKGKYSKNMGWQKVRYKDYIEYN